MHNPLANIFMLIFVVGSLFGSGLALTVSEIIAPIRRVKLVFLTLLINFLLIPGLTYVTVTSLKLDQSLSAGLIILACSAGAPFLPALAKISGGGLAFSVGLMVLLMAATVFYAPLVIPFLLPGTTINPLSIANPLIFYMILPLVAGLIIKAANSNLAERIRPFAKKISLVSVLILAVLSLFFALPTFVRAFGTGAYNSALLFVAGSLALGYFFSGEKSADKYVMALGAGQRNIMAALLIAATNFSDPNVLTTIMIVSLVGFVVLFPAAAIFKKLQHHV